MSGGNTSGLLLLLARKHTQIHREKDAEWTHTKWMLKVMRRWWWWWWWHDRWWSKLMFEKRKKRIVTVLGQSLAGRVRSMCWAAIYGNSTLDFSMFLHQLFFLFFLLHYLTLIARATLFFFFYFFVILIPPSPSPWKRELLFAVFVLQYLSCQPTEPTKLAAAQLIVICCRAK